jgi:hypothetical protein
MGHGKHITILVLLTICVLLSYGCATFNPRPIEEVPFRERAQTKSGGNVRVTAVVLSAEETKEVFDLDLYKRGIQPIWLEIENNDEGRIWFPPAGTDPDYFAPLEVAYIHHFTFSKSTNEQMDKYFHEQTIREAIPPGKVRSGFVFTHLDLGTKAFNVDLVGEDQQIRTFSFFISVPGLRVSHQEVDGDTLYTKDGIVSYDDERDLRKALENLPCCITNQDGTKQGKPINLVIIGSGKALHHALIRRGWDETESLKTESTSERHRSSISAKKYRYESVNPLYFYDRHQDAAFRKTRVTADERNQLRLWLSPIRHEGKDVWIGQISRNIKVRYLPHTFRLEPLVDEARTYILQDLWFSQGLEKYGYVKGVGPVSMSEPHADLKGETYFTDGYRLVLWLSSSPISFSEVEVVHWEIPQRIPSENETINRK